MHILSSVILKVYVWVAVVSICMVMLFDINWTVDEISHHLGRIISESIVPPHDVPTHIAEKRVSAMNITVT